MHPLRFVLLKIMLGIVAVACNTELADEEDSHMDASWNGDADMDRDMDVDAANLPWAATQSNDPAGADNEAQEHAIALTDIQLHMYSILEAVASGEISPEEAARHLDALEELEASAGQDTSTD